MKTVMRALCALLCAMLLLPPVFASAEEAAAEEPFTVIREGELEALIEEYLADNRIHPDSIGIGFLYTATGEEWYYNGDLFLYSASLYKVPLMMLISNMVATGELEQDALIQGRTLTEMEEYILVASNNTYAHILMNTFWPNDRDCRALWPALAGMTLEDMPDGFVKTSVFSPRFMTRVMYTLYSDPDSYPLMIDFLKRSAPNKYFRYQLEGQYEIAQKFGYYEEYRHVSGIIYTEHPIIVTYMTRDIQAHGKYSSDLALRLIEYSKTLDRRLEEHEQELLRQEREAEQARLRAEEEARAAEAEAAARAERERAEAEAERVRAEEEAAAAEAAAKAEKTRSALLIPGAACAVCVVSGLALSAARKKNRAQVKKGENDP